MVLKTSLIINLVRDMTVKEILGGKTSIVLKLDLLFFFSAFSFTTKLDKESE